MDLRYFRCMSPIERLLACLIRIGSPDVPRLTRILPVALLFCFAFSACAQGGVITIRGWRVHNGDDPAWAQPGFDDSQWATVEFEHFRGGDLPSGMHWFRATFAVPKDLEEQQLVLGMGPLDEVYTVYINGQQVGQSGSWQPTPRGPFPRHLVFPIPAALLKGAVAHIAIRQWNSPLTLGWLTFSPAGSYQFTHLPEIGTRDAIEPREQLHRMAGAVQRMPWDLTDLLLVFAASVSFVLFSVQRRKTEYLYLGIFCLLWGGSFLVAIPLVFDPAIMGRSWIAVLVFASPFMGNAFSALFLAELCPRVRRILQIGAIYLAIAAVLISYAYAKPTDTAPWILWVSEGIPTWCLSICDLIATGALLLDRRVGSSAIAFCLLLNQAAWVVHVSFAFYAGPFRVDPPSLTMVLFVFVTLLVLFLRYRGEQARQVAIEQDLAAARRMQQQLLAGSEEIPAGFAVEAIYRPSREVGGDFYRSVGLEDGSLLVIIGDVSGKGLDAAMLVAAMLGSLANETHRNPASLLGYLNCAAIGRTAGGFVTACCARFYPDGRVMLANAGQIAPYMDGDEVPLENGFPLGISAEATYIETEIKADGVMTFLSDGVVEARNAKGELLGFERMAALTTKHAEEIADAAQQWGQEDDITVVTVVSTPQGTRKVPAIIEHVGQASGDQLPVGRLSGSYYPARLPGAWQSACRLASQASFSSSADRTSG